MTLACYIIMKCPRRGKTKEYQTNARSMNWHYQFSASPSKHRWNQQWLMEDLNCSASYSQLIWLYCCDQHLNPSIYILSITTKLLPTQQATLLRSIVNIARKQHHFEGLRRVFTSPIFSDRIESSRIESSFNWEWRCRTRLRFSSQIMPKVDRSSHQQTRISGFWIKLPKIDCKCNRSTSDQLTNVNVNAKDLIDRAKK